MKIKLIAIALLGTALVSSPIFAHTDATDFNSSRANKSEDSGIDHSGDANDEVDSKEAGSGMATGKRTYEPLVIKKGIDKASPLGVDKIGDIQGESTKASDFGTRVSTEGQAHRGSVDVSDNDSESPSSKAYIKIGDIKGNSTKAADLSPGAIDGIVVGAVTDSDSSEGTETDCDHEKNSSSKEQLDTCVDGHVTVLK